MAGVDDEGTGFGQYRLGRLLGRGGFGEVYEAVDTRMGRRVALKVISPAYSQDEAFRQRMFREAQTAGRLHEPHVVPVHSCGEIDGRLFIDMRLIEGTDVRGLLADTGAMDPARAVDVVSQVAAALDAAHAQSIVHRDVKPANILLTDGDFAYLVDFGLANADGDTRLTQSGTAVGTLAYMAPERFSGEDAGVAGDVYALACVLFECVTGSPPFAGDTPSVINGHLSSPVPAASRRRPGIPPALDSVIAKGMAKDPRDRYPSAGALAAGARDVLSRPDFHQAETVMADPVRQVDWSPPRTPRIELPPPQGFPQVGLPAKVGFRTGRAVLVALVVLLTVGAVVTALSLNADSSGQSSTDAFKAKLDRSNEELPFGELSNPTAVAVDDTGAVLIADGNYGTSRLLKLPPGATSPIELPHPGVDSVHGLAFDGAGNLYATNPDEPYVFKWSPGAGAPVKLPGAVQVSARYRLFAVDRAGAVYAFDSGRRLVKLPPGGAEPIELPVKLEDDPTGIAVDDAGTVYIADTVNRVLKLPTGAAGPVKLGDVENGGEVAVDGAGNAYVESTSGMVKFSPTGERVDLPYTGSYTHIAVDNAGVMYATSTTPPRVVRVQFD
ncbi:serine/threonine-protein kinase [Mycolicibacterium setense]